MTADFYGETFIPEKYARSAYADLFTLERFFFESTRELHPIMIFRKVLMPLNFNQILRDSCVKKSR